MFEKGRFGMRSICTVGNSGCEGGDFPLFPPIVPLPPLVVPANNPQTAAKIELGKQLYFDPRLSGNNWISCATCHNPVLGFGDGLPPYAGWPDL